MATSGPKQGARKDREKLPSIEIAIEYGNIAAAEPARTPADAVAVGHYIGVKPVAAERALDVAISSPLPGKSVGRSSKKGSGETEEADLLLTQYTERGIIHGRLGQPFILPDPRAAGKKNDRLIIIAGMGEPGRFGVPELTVMVRELCWSVGRLGKTHLATVLIGSGNGNLEVPDAINGWLQGVARALTGSDYDKGRHLKRISFIEYDPRKIKRMEKTLIEQAEQLQSKLNVHYEKLDEQTNKTIEKDAFAWNRREWMRQQNSEAKSGDQIPVRITLGLDRGVYKYGAMTESASVPERSIALDPALVSEANDELAAAGDKDKQLEKGLVLERLLLPKDLRPHVSGNAPVVMMLDAATARVHWEMVAQPDPMLATDSPATGSNFLGTSRGFTRQLRTTFAPPPEPPPPPRRTLQVLVVADPADDARLPGAQKEGIEVANLFEMFNEVNESAPASRRNSNEPVNEIRVKRMIGPQEATRTAVLSELLLNTYHVLHFAGHCVYNSDAPSSSGWIFSGGKTLSAYELDRIDRIPKFVFSNACESGITPDRSEKRSADLAPSFAEAFFARGVSNFVCTAWPVDDSAALDFALSIYRGLLGISEDGERKDPLPMHEAMREARLKIADTSYGVRTWGAYQHYGNPYFRLFYSTSSSGRRGTGSSRGSGRKRAGRSAAARGRNKR